jgi:hypothetical protein
MNIIFLDVDGVINSQDNLRFVYAQTHRQMSGCNYPFDKRCLEHLKEIVEATDAYIVITSVWRRDPKHLKILIQKLEEFDLASRVIGLTPVLNKTRGEEIKAFLSTFSTPVNYVILDDDNDVQELEEHLVKTQCKTGLTSKETEIAIKKLVPNYKKNQ